jgi:hypothetical protein
MSKRLTENVSFLAPVAGIFIIGVIIAVIILVSTAEAQEDPNLNQAPIVQLTDNSSTSQYQYDASPTAEQYEQFGPLPETGGPGMRVVAAVFGIGLCAVGAALLFFRGGGNG